MVAYSDQKFIVITGAAGFIGSAVVRYLNDQNHHRLLLVDDIKNSIKWKNLHGKRFEDLISKHALWNWLEVHGKEVGAIIHLGACSNTLEQDGDYLLDNNYRYSVRLATFALAHGIRFIYASSAATYGDGSKGFDDRDENIDTLEPLNLYGYSKQLFDLWVKRRQAFDRVVGLKYFNVFGPNEYHKGPMASMVYKMFPKVRDEGVVELFKSNVPELFADGEQCRDFIYVKDVARMTCSFLGNQLSGLYNLGLGQPVTWNRLAAALFRAMNKPLNIRYVDMPAHLSKQYQNYTCARMDKIFSALGQDNPFNYSIETAVMDYVQGYLIKDVRW